MEIYLFCLLKRLKFYLNLDVLMVYSALVSESDKKIVKNAFKLS